MKIWKKHEKRRKNDKIGKKHKKRVENGTFLVILPPINSDETPFLPFFTLFFRYFDYFCQNSLKDTLSHYKSYKNTAWDVYSPTFHTWVKLPVYSSTSLHILKASFQVYIYLGQYIDIAYASYNKLSCPDYALLQRYCAAAASLPF